MIDKIPLIVAVLCAVLFAGTALIFRARLASERTRARRLSNKYVLTSDALRVVRGELRLANAKIAAIETQRKTALEKANAANRAKRSASQQTKKSSAEGAAAKAGG